MFTVARNNFRYIGKLVYVMIFIIYTGNTRFCLIVKLESYLLIRVNYYTKERRTLVGLAQTATKVTRKFSLITLFVENVSEYLIAYLYEILG